MYQNLAGTQTPESRNPEDAVTLYFREVAENGPLLRPIESRRNSQDSLEEDPWKDRQPLTFGEEAYTKSGMSKKNVKLTIRLNPVLYEWLELEGHVSELQSHHINIERETWWYVLNRLSARLLRIG